MPKPNRGDELSGAKDWDDPMARYLAKGGMDAAVDILEKEIVPFPLATPTLLRVHPDCDTLRGSP